MTNSTMHALTTHQLLTVTVLINETIQMSVARDNSEVCFYLHIYEKS